MKLKPTVHQMVREFHEVMGLPIREHPELPSAEERALRYDLMYEEWSEYDCAEMDDSLEEIAAELADIVYVAYGTAIEYGIPLDEVIAEKHRSNMTKLDDEGNPVLREDGKVLKGPNFKPADIQSVLNEYKCDDPPKSS